MTKVPACASFKQAFPTDGIVLVGVCAAGKTTVSHLLRERGIPARVVAQEHSTVPELYRHGGDGWLVMLCADWQTVHRRRRLSWDPEFYHTEWIRLSQARQEAGLVIHTDMLSAQAVADVIAAWWQQRHASS